MSYSVAMLSVHTSPLDHPGRTKDAGGMNVYMRELASALAQHHTIDIFTRRTNKHTPVIVPLGENIRVIHVEAGPASPVPKHDLYQYLPLFARNLEEFRRNHALHYDLIHSHYWLSGVVAQHLAWQWDAPHITMFHTLARMKQLARPNLNTDEPESQLRTEKERWLIQHTDRIIAPTAEERQQLIRYYGATAHQIEVIPCGIDLSLFAPRNRELARAQLGLPADQPVLLFVGRLDPYKGPDLLLHAAAMMEKRAYVVIVGGKLCNDRELQQLRTLATTLGIADRVRFLGARPRHELPLLYSAADATVMPSYHESFGLASLESLACGTPVVATRAGGPTTIVHHGETGFLVPRCAGFFAERLDTLLNNAVLLARMSAAARDSVQQFSWEQVAVLVERLYDELLLNEECLVAQ
jgi:D-inositol-3-phosphate glycosyltransferase